MQNKNPTKSYWSFWRITIDGLPLSSWNTFPPLLDRVECFLHLKLLKTVQLSTAHITLGGISSLWTSHYKWQQTHNKPLPAVNPGLVTVCVGSLPFDCGCFHLTLLTPILFSSLVGWWLIRNGSIFFTI